MRNLKKFLALVLAMMMAFSLMVTVNAASLDDYADSSSVSSRYAEAVDILTRVGVFEGTSTATFNPAETITRAEMAAIVYRVMTGDTDKTDINLYLAYDNDFTDVVAGSWYEPYVNYANNAGLVVGDGNGHFYPMTKIDGYQVLAILLRALGYDQPGEFENRDGKDWKNPHRSDRRPAAHHRQLGLHPVRQDPPSGRGSDGLQHGRQDAAPELDPLFGLCRHQRAPNRDRQQDPRR